MQRDKLENLLTLHQQRLSAGRKNADVRRPLVDVFRKRRDDVDHVLATVEDEKKAAIAQKGDDAVGGIGMMHDKAQAPQRRCLPRASRLLEDRDQENTHGLRTPSACRGPARRRRSSCQFRLDLSA